MYMFFNIKYIAIYSFTTTEGPDMHIYINGLTFDKPELPCQVCNLLLNILLQIQIDNEVGVAGKVYCVD